MSSSALALESKSALSVESDASIESEIRDAIAGLTPAADNDVDNHHLAEEQAPPGGVTPTEPNSPRRPNTSSWIEDGKGGIVPRIIGYNGIMVGALTLTFSSALLLAAVGYYAVGSVLGGMGLGAAYGVGSYQLGSLVANHANAIERKVNVHAAEVKAKVKSHAAKLKANMPTMRQSLEYLALAILTVGVIRGVYTKLRKDKKEGLDRGVFKKYLYNTFDLIFTLSLIPLIYYAGFTQTTNIFKKASGYLMVVVTLFNGVLMLKQLFGEESSLDLAISEATDTADELIERASNIEHAEGGVGNPSEKDRANWNSLADHWDNPRDGNCREGIAYEQTWVDKLRRAVKKIATKNVAVALAVLAFLIALAVGIVKYYDHAEGKTARIARRAKRKGMKRKVYTQSGSVIDDPDYDGDFYIRDDDGKLVQITSDQTQWDDESQMFTSELSEQDFGTAVGYGGKHRYESGEVSESKNMCKKNGCDRKCGKIHRPKKMWKPISKKEAIRFQLPESVLAASDDTPEAKLAAPQYPVAKVLNSVGHCQTQAKQACATVVSGMVVTVDHIFKDASDKCTFWMGGKEWASTKSEGIVVGNDLLAFKPPNGSVFPSLRVNQRVDLLDPVAIVGASSKPQVVGGLCTISTGRVKCVEGERVYYDGSSEDGNCGAPIIDGNGRVVAIHTGTNTTLNYGVRPKIPSSSVPTPAVSGGVLGKDQAQH
jgi:hypothetical protein